MPRSETALVLASACAFTALAAAWLAISGAGPLALVVGAALAFDVAGGAVCNATDTTKRWVHRPGLGPAQHLAFVLPHLAHVAAVAWLLRPGPFDAAYLAVVGGALVASAAVLVASAAVLVASAAVLVASAAVLVATPPSLKRPAAAALVVGSVGVAFAAVGPTPGLEWFVPALFLKLLVGHLVPERPAA